MHVEKIDAHIWEAKNSKCLLLFTTDFCQSATQPVQLSKASSQVNWTTADD